MLRLKFDVMIVDDESPTHATLENLATLSVRMPHPVVMYLQDGDAASMRRALKGSVSAR